ncbi:MAG: DUF190 domain-containing protein [Rhodanobacter sp.]
MNREKPQTGAHRNFYCQVRTRRHGTPLSEWLLERVRMLRIGCGSVFRAMAGFGHHGMLHEDQCFELADDLPAKVEFLLLEFRLSCCWRMCAVPELT